VYIIVVVVVISTTTGKETNVVTIPPVAPPPRLLDSIDVAAVLGFTSETVCRYARDGMLCGEKIGGRWRFGPEDVQLFLDTRNQETARLVEERFQDRQQQTDET
jgi:hypothetical protein